MKGNFDLSAPLGGQGAGAGPDTFERIPVSVYATPDEGARAAAAAIAALLRQRAAEGCSCVLGLATGSTMIAVYAELLRLHREEGLSFRNAVTFNLDEYYPIDRTAYQSYYQFMQRHLFQQVDIAPANIHLPDGSLPKEAVRAHCAAYEEAIAAAGGIDLQLLGIGHNGHIGFNEPGSGLHTRTRLVNLEPGTRMANSYEFANPGQVPRLAISMGLSTILQARRIILLAWGPGKARIVRQAVEGQPSESVPASLLQQHPDCRFVVDTAAAAELTRLRAPWLAGEVEWTSATVRRAVVRLALEKGKPVLWLTNKDYTEAGLGDLLADRGDAYTINLEVYYALRDSITGWPGGKQGAGSSHPERAEPWPKRVLIFSPHPDDDIISMGGTFRRLHEQGHTVHVAYQTSGNIAVTDEFLLRHLDFAAGFEAAAGDGNEQTGRALQEVHAYLAQKGPHDLDSPLIRSLKGLIRRGEARATCRYVGLPEDQVHFQNLPFYETGTIEKNPMGPEDVRITKELLQTVRPHQVFAAGDLADPHGTHKVCLDVVLQALKELKESGAGWIGDCRLWLYKGAWQEWDVEEIDMAVPMSPGQVLEKRHGIFMHQSQKDIVPFQGDDAREFWQRAEERNAHTADAYAQLGLTRYAALEAFKRWDF
ncbi:glucosamine-6-phosphate deaminase [Flaviaesturariibacter aridisoli]|uniref:Glucosamine-6-phosphate deaminase n=1 Tax=Flaviaesturariibacter aridisoli TaxID=2545761 RepID=A0A4V2WMY0_9BACT|nr:glucosamine-6-phosphate deaminase [Flaviaesturariibacter aridisoli]TCZ73272.1 glucosamine-6-phosphate deaminase [Flaviaesturariibacter aridisoli]